MADKDPDTARQKRAAQNVEKLKAEWEKADKALIELGNEYQAKRDKLRDQYRPKMVAANEKAVQTQKAYCDADAAAALLGRDDAETVAQSLGLTLPDEESAPPSARQ